MKALLTTARRELSRISREPLLWLVDLALPLGIGLWLLVTYQPGSVRELPIVVVDQDQTSFSRMLTRALDATSGIKVQASATRPEAIIAALQAGRAQGGVVLPDGLMRQIKRGENAELVLYANAANIVVGNTLVKEVSTVSRTLSGGITLRRARAQGLDAVHALAVAEPIHINSQVLFNPTYSYLSYMVPGLIAALLQLFAMLAGVMAFDPEHHTLADKHTAALPWVLGKMLPHLLLLWSTACVALALFVAVFHGEPATHALRLVPLYGVYLAGSFGLGMTLATLLPRTSLAIEVALFLSTPAFILSGMSFPFEAMPKLLVAFAKLLPFTHYLTGALQVHAMNQPLVAALPALVWLGALGIGAVGITATKHAWQARAGLQEGVS